MAPGLVMTEMADSDGFRRYSGFEDLPADEWQTAGRLVASSCCAIAAGDADPLSGRFLHVKDDLDELLAEAAAGHVGAAAADAPARLTVRSPPPSRPGIQFVPASGTRAIAAASMVSATRSSGSRLCTCDLPHARASVCASSVSTRR